MSAMGPYSADIPIGNTPDGKPVNISPQFFDYVARQIFLRIGGVTAPTNSELVVDLHDDAGIEEMKADVIALANGLGCSPPVLPRIEQPPQEPDRLAALEAVVAELRKQVQDIRQGLVIV